MGLRMTFEVGICVAGSRPSILTSNVEERRGHREVKAMRQITLGAARYQPEDREDPFLPRTLAGWHETMSDNDVYDAARGWWRLNVARAQRERYSVVVARGIA